MTAADHKLALSETKAATLLALFGTPNGSWLLPRPCAARWRELSL
jgi:hypothetical protein